jgi:hypothetical protein
MFERLKELLARIWVVGDHETDEPADSADDRDAGIPVPVWRGPLDRYSSVAVAEPDDH